MPRLVARSRYRTAVETIIQERVLVSSSTQQDSDRQKIRKTKSSSEDVASPPKKFYRATTETLDLAPIFVYEELKSTAFQEDGKPLFSLSKCQFEGGLFEERAPYIKACHLIRSSDAQLVNCLNLHHTCHYSVNVEQLLEFEQLASDLSIPIKVYDKEKSYTDPCNFLQVFNYGTDSFSKIEGVFNELSFERTALGVDKKYKKDSRGNFQAAFGLSTQSHNKRNELGVAYPQFRKNTADHVDSFLVTSKLSELTGTYSRGVVVPDENSLPPSGTTTKPNSDHMGCYFDLFAHADQSVFARAIDEDVIHEGLTDGGYNEWLQLNVHCDVHNCFLQGRNGAMICSRVVLEEVPDPVCNDGHHFILVPRRYIIIAYMQKVAADFAKRQEKHGKIAALAKDFFLHEIPSWRREINRDFALHGWDEVVDGCVFNRPCNMDKTAWYSSIADSLLRFMRFFEPGLKAICDLCSILPALADSHIFPRVLNEWIKDGQIPPGPLLLGFSNTAIDLSGAFDSGPAARKQVCLNDFLDTTQLDLSRRNLFKIVQMANRELKYDLTAQKDRIHAYSKLIDRISADVDKGGLYYCNELGAQHLVAVLSFCGVLHQPWLLVQAKISDGTRTAERLQTVFGVEPKDFPVLLATVASALSVELPVAENVLCEMTRRHQKLDCWLPGQWMFQVTRLATGARKNTIQVSRFDPFNKDIAAETVPPFTPSSHNDLWIPYPRGMASLATKAEELRHSTTTRVHISVYFRTKVESVAFAEKVNSKPKSAIRMFANLYRSHPLSLRNRTTKTKVHNYLKRKSGLSKSLPWQDLTLRLLPFAEFVNEKRLTLLGYWNEEKMRPHVCHAIHINGKKRSFGVMEVTDPLSFAPPALRLTKKQKARVELVRKRLKRVTSTSTNAVRRPLFSSRDRLTGNQKNKPSIDSSLVRSWVFDINEPDRISQHSVKQGLGYIPTHFGARPFRPGKKVDASKHYPPAMEPSGKFLRWSPDCVGFDSCFPPRDVADNPVYAKFFPLSSNGLSLCHIAPHLQSLTDLVGSEACQVFSKQPYRRQCLLQTIVSSLIGPFRVSYLDIGCDENGRAFSAIVSSKQKGNFHLGSLPRTGGSEVKPHPYGLARMLTKGPNSFTCHPIHFYQSKSAALSAVLIDILVHFRDPDAPDRGVTNRHKVFGRKLFRDAGKVTLLIDVHTGYRSKSVPTLLFRVESEKVYMGMPDADKEGVLVYRL